MQLAVARVAEERRRHLQPLERILHVPQENGQRRGRHGDVFDARHRPRRALQPIERRHETLREAPIQLEVAFVLGDVRSGGQAGLVLERARRLRRAWPARRPPMSAVLLDEQHRLGLAGNQQLVANVALAGEVQVPAIHQVARGRLERQ